MSFPKAFVQALASVGIRHLFTNPGTEQLPIYEVLRQTPAITTVFVQHESGASYAADGYYKSSGLMAATLSVPGPGATNMLSGVAAALGDGSPMLAITSQISQHKFNRQGQHDCDLAAIYRAAVKEQIVLDENTDPYEVISRAAKSATSSPTGPVQIILAAEALAASAVTREFVRPSETATSAAQPSPDSLRRAAEVLNSAKNPLIYAGGGAADAGQQIRALAERLRIPVLTSLTGRGVISEDDPFCFGHLNFAGIELVLSTADAALAVGTRFSEYSTLGWRRRMPQPLAQVDINADALSVNEPVIAPVVGDAAVSLEGILTHVKPRVADTELLHLTRRLKAEEQARLHQFLGETPRAPLHPLWVISTLRNLAPPNTIFIGEGTAAQTWLLEQALTVYEPRTHIFPEVALAMGYAVGASLGAALACPDRPVIAVLGDGSLKMQLGELATATTLDRGLVFVVFNDSYYNALRIRLEHQFGWPYFGVELPRADFAAVATGLGLRAVRCAEPDAFVAAVKSAMEGNQPVLIDAITDYQPLSRFSQVSTGTERPYHQTSTKTS